MPIKTENYIADKLATIFEKCQDIASSRIEILEQLESNGWKLHNETEKLSDFSKEENDNRTFYAASIKLMPDGCFGFMSTKWLDEEEMELFTEYLNFREYIDHVM